MKWRTLCSAGTKEDLLDMINSYYFSKDYVIGEQLENGRYLVYNNKTNRIMPKQVRYFRKRWQYGIDE